VGPGVGTCARVVSFSCLTGPAFGDVSGGGLEC
jgi:hypothetical protein